ncbi:MAG: Bax inhibitor-1/YccA family protein [Gammaproteobacteria bacterium]|nr:Bax inhibitor-1/YccA family protein [Gammaproteobacteria bacterium]
MDSQELKTAKAPLQVPLTAEMQQSVSNFMNHVYRWMSVGILITAVTALVTSYYMFDVIWYFKHQEDGYTQFKWLLGGLFVLQLTLVIGLTAFINKLSQRAAILSYLFYAFVTGLTFSFIFYSYTQADISSAFFITVVAFAGLAIYGYVTKKDLKFIGTFCTMGLFGLVGVFIYAMFVPSFMTDSMQLYTGIVGVVVFSGLTAYDSQKIRNMGIALLQKQPPGTTTQDSAIKAIENSEPADISQKIAIVGALLLYLDFINLFLSILRVMRK